MYVCKKHGELESEWCDDCQEVVECDCSDVEKERYKDLIYDCAEGERTITIYLFYCGTCGYPISAEF